MRDFDEAKACLEKEGLFPGSTCVVDGHEPAVFLGLAFAPSGRELWRAIVRKPGSSWEAWRLEVVSVRSVRLPISFDS